MRIAISLLIIAALAGCVFVTGRSSYTRTDSVQQDGSSNRMNRTDVTVKP